MKMIYEKIESDVVIEEDTHLHGMIVGSTTVSSDITFNLHGMIIGNLILKNNSNVYIHGMVNGNIINKGGRLEVFGIVNGRIIKESGITNIHDRAIINEN
jgi:cytoskeletal protein CcmA (bactofilin family)